MLFYTELGSNREEKRMLYNCGMKIVNEGQGKGYVYLILNNI